MSHTICRRGYLNDFFISLTVWFVWQPFLLAYLLGWFFFFSPFHPCRSSERESTFATPSLGKDVQFVSTPLLPITTSTPAAASAGAAHRSRAGTRKRRRLAASPGGLHWNAAGEVNNMLAVWTTSKLQVTLTWTTWLLVNNLIYMFCPELDLKLETSETLLFYL